MPSISVYLLIAPKRPVVNVANCPRLTTMNPQLFNLNMPALPPGPRSTTHAASSSNRQVVNAIALRSPSNKPPPSLPAFPCLSYRVVEGSARKHAPREQSGRGLPPHSRARTNNPARTAAPWSNWPPRARAKQPSFPIVGSGGSFLFTSPLRG